MSRRRSGIVGRRYLDPGDKPSGFYDPPREVIVRVQWGPKGPHGSGPCNVLVEVLPDGRLEVIPFFRRLRLPRK